MAKKEKVTSNPPKRLTGEKVTGTQTPIRFFVKKETEEEFSDGKGKDVVSIPVKINPSGGQGKGNMTESKFKLLDTFADAGERAINLRRELDVKVYGPMGLKGSSQVVERMRYLTIVLGTTAVQQLAKAFSQAFVEVSLVHDPSMDLVKRSNMTQHESQIALWMSQPRSTVWNGLTRQCPR